MQFGLVLPETVSYHHEPVLNGALQSSGENDAPFNYVVVIVMENQGICDIVISKTCPNATALYMTSLSNSGGLAENYTAITHPSLPNYLALLSGQDWGCSVDRSPHTDECTNNAWNSTNANLVDRLEASGLTWKAYMEAMPSDCDTADSGRYTARHDPFVYFKDIVNDPARCDKVIPAGTNSTNLLNDLDSTTTASNFMWLSPDLCNDMHNDCTANVTSPYTCTGGGNSTNIAHTVNCIHQGDTYLSRLVPRILNSTIFATQRAALFVTFDEGNGYCPHNLNTKEDCIYTVWAGPVVKQGYTSLKSYSHYSFLATVEAAWSLPPLTTNDTSALPMSEFFTTLFPIHFSTSPTIPEIGRPIQFNATTSGGTSPYLFKWNFGDNTNVSGNPTNHTYTSPGTYLVVVNATDDRGATTVSKQTVTVGPIVRFRFNPASPAVGQQITLSANATTGVAPYVFNWSLGDNSLSTGNSIAHTYASAGPFNVRVNVTDALGVTASYSRTINVALRNSSTIVACSPSATTISQSVTCTAMVADASIGTTSTPTGSVGFESSLALGTFNDTGCSLVRGSCDVTFVQTDFTSAPTIIARYSGDSTHSASLGAATVSVSLRSTSTTISCPLTGTASVALSCSATVADTGSGSASAPLGTITFSYGETCILVAGSCSVDILPSIAGPQNVWAYYTPSDSTHGASSAKVLITIYMIPSQTSSQPGDRPCLFSLCYPMAVWTYLTIGVVLVAVASSMLVFRGRLRHRQLLRLTKRSSHITKVP